MLNSCPTTEAVEYLRDEWKKYEMKCRDIKVGTTILMELDPTVIKRIMAGVEEQSKEYSKLTSNMERILTNLTNIQHNNQQQRQQREPDKEPKIIKELCPDTLTKENNPIEFRNSKGTSSYTTRSPTWKGPLLRDKNSTYKRA